MNEPHRVAVIGAGLAGLVATRTLAAASTEQHPIEVLLVDKGRSVGGRLATRRMAGATLDHGAQFFTVRSDDFAAAVERWTEAGIVEEWCRGFAENDGYPRYRVAGGMNALAKHLADGLSPITRRQVNAIIPGPDAWALTYEAASREPDEVDSIIATPPVPQTLALLASGATALDPSIAAALDAVEYHKVIAVLTVLDRSPDLAAPGALQRPDHPTFSFVADNQAKGISAEPAVTFHLSHGLSAELWDSDDRTVLEHVDAELTATLGPATVTEFQVKRWRYAGPKTPFPEPTMVAATEPGHLVMAGDGFGGSKVEGAFTSGLAAANHIVDSVTRTRAE